jgi:hypothetical protein
MATPTYSLSWILPFVRQSLRGRGNFSYDNFVWGLWPELEKAGVPGVVRTPPDRMYLLQPYDYSQAPHELRRVTTEAFYYLFHNGLTMPEPPQNLPGHPSQATYHLTPRGLGWAAGVEPLPEDVDGYMKVLRELVSNLDSVIEQYVREGLSSFERQTYFAAAVMVGAAAEKAVYLLAESMVDAFTDARRQETFKKLIERRKLNELFHTTEKTIHDAYVSKALPFPLFDGAVTHLMSLIEAIKVQRNDAVHPMNAIVSADSVRLSFAAFPHAMEKLEALRAWFLANPRSI